MKKTVIIQGSARSDGHTATVVSYLKEKVNADVIDLKLLDFSYFDYQHRNRNDAFIPLMKKIVEEYQTLILASPVYWYSMSAEMKTFIDRISDCLKIEKPTGRKLRGMSMAVLSCGQADDLPEGFFRPFQLTADYLGMKYVAEVHTWIDGTIERSVLQRIDTFAEVLTSDLSNKST